MKKTTKSLVAVALSVAMAFAPMTTVSNVNKVNAATTKTVNLAEGKTVVSSSNENASLSAENAVDGDKSTRWSSAWKDGEWIMVDLGDIYAVGAVSIYWEAAYAAQYTISWSQDNITWYDATTKGISSYMEDTSDMFYNRPVRYIKVTCDKRATSYGVSIYEIEILGNVTVEETTAPVTTVAPETTVAETTQASASLDWSNIDYAGDGAFGGQASNQYKFAAIDNNGSLVNIQKPGFANEAGLYVTFDSAIVSSSVASYYIQGAGIVLGLSSFTAKETIFTVTTATGTYKCAVYNEKGGEVDTTTVATETTTVAETTTVEVTTEAETVNSNTNLALGKTVVSSSDENSSLVAKYAVDGDKSTRWSSAWKDGEWIMVDLGKIYAVGAVTIYWEAAYAANYTISWSQDNVTWNDACTMGVSGYMEDTCDMFYNRPVRYIKIKCNKRATQYGVSILDIDIRGAEYTGQIYTRG